MFLVALKQYYLGTFLSLLFYEKLTLCSNLGRLSHSDFVQLLLVNFYFLIFESKTSILSPFRESTLRLCIRSNSNNRTATARYAYIKEQDQVMYYRFYKNEHVIFSLLKNYALYLSGYTLKIKNQ